MTASTSTTNPSTLRKSSRNAKPIKKGEFLYDVASEADEIIQPYNINVKKSMLKKQAACKRDPIHCQLKKGNQIRIKLSTSAYEVFRLTTIELYTLSPQLLDMKDSIYANHKKIYDKSNAAIVQEIISVYNRLKSGDQGSRLKYTINLYHTTSSVLVNGPRVDLFREKHLHPIVNTINSIHPELVEMDGALYNLMKPLSANDKDKSNYDSTKSAHSDKKADFFPYKRSGVTGDEADCYTVLSKRSRQSGVQEDYITTTSTSPIGVESTLMLLAPSTDADENHSVSCPVCDTPAVEECIECSYCLNWIHFSCTALPDGRIESLRINPVESFACKSCTELHKHDSHINDNTLPGEPLSDADNNTAKPTSKSSASLALHPPTNIVNCHPEFANKTDIPAAESSASLALHPPSVTDNNLPEIANKTAKPSSKSAASLVLHPPSVTDSNHQEIAIKTAKPASKSSAPLVSHPPSATDNTQQEIASKTAKPSSKYYASLVLLPPSVTDNNHLEIDFETAKPTSKPSASSVLHPSTVTVNNHLQIANKTASTNAKADASLELHPPSVTDNNHQETANKTAKLSSDSSASSVSHPPSATVNLHQEISNKTAKPSSKYSASLVLHPPSATDNNHPEIDNKTANPTSKSAASLSLLPSTQTSDSVSVSEPNKRKESVKAKQKIPHAYIGKSTGSQNIKRDSKMDDNVIENKILMESLKGWESNLKMREKQLKDRENELKEALKQLNTTKVYATKLENKIVDLEVSLNLANQLKKTEQTPSHPLQGSYTASVDNNIHNRLEQRLHNLEISTMQEKISKIETKIAEFDSILAKPAQQTMIPGVPAYPTMYHQQPAFMTMQSSGPQHFLPTLPRYGPQLFQPRHTPMYSQQPVHRSHTTAAPMPGHSAYLQTPHNYHVQGTYQPHQVPMAPQTATVFGSQLPSQAHFPPSQPYCKTADVSRDQKDRKRQSTPTVAPRAGISSDAVKRHSVNTNKTKSDDHATPTRKIYIPPHKRMPGKLNEDSGSGAALQKHQDNQVDSTALPLWCEYLCTGKLDEDNNSKASGLKKSCNTSTTSSNCSKPIRNTQGIEQRNHSTPKNKHPATGPKRPLFSPASSHRPHQADTDRQSPVQPKKVKQHMKSQIFRRSISPRGSTSQQQRGHQSSFLDFGRETKERWLHQGARPKSHATY